MKLSKKIAFAFFLIVGIMVISTASANEKRYLALVVPTLDTPFFAQLKAGAEKKAANLNYELIVLDSQNNPEQEFINIETLIHDGAHLILFNPIDPSIASNAVLAANQAHIPIITMMQKPEQGDVVSHVASDNIHGAKMAGDFIAEKVNEHAQIIQLEGIVGASTTLERCNGFNKAVNENGMKLLFSQTADADRAKGMNVMQNLLTAYPHVQAVFAHNDEMALGALRAVRSAGRKDIVVVGFDGTNEGIQSIEFGRLTATIAHQPELIGETGVETAHKVLNGESVNSFIPVDLKLITQK